MKKNVVLYFAAIVLLNFSSCMQDHPNESDVMKEVKISASIESATDFGKASTRATDNTWADGDEIGVFMKNTDSDLSHSLLADNVKFSTDGGGLFTNSTENKIYFPFNKKNVDFISYYPYASSLTDLNYKIDVTNQDDFSNLDLLYSNNVKVVNSDVESVELVFEHQLTMIILNISTDNTAINLPNLSAEITKVHTDAIFSLSDGILTVVDSPNSVAFKVNDDGTEAKAIVLPDGSLEDKSLIITIDEITYSYSLSDSKIGSFEKSKKCVFNITIESGQGPELEGVTATITDWTTETENIIVTEDPFDNSGEEDFIDDENKSAASSTGGDGTKMNPYIISQLLGEVTKGKNVWIKGYIVGAYNGQGKKHFVNNTNEGREQTLALALSPDETNFEMTFPISFVASGNDKFKNDLNLKRHPDIFKKELYIKGNLGDFSGSLGLVEPTEAYIGDVEYK